MNPEVFLAVLKSAFKAVLCLVPVAIGIGIWLLFFINPKTDPIDDQAGVKIGEEWE